MQDHRIHRAAGAWLVLIVGAASWAGLFAVGARVLAS